MRAVTLEPPTSKSAVSAQAARDVDLVGLVGLVAVLTLLGVRNRAVDVVTVNGDTVRDLQSALAIARGWINPVDGPEVPWMGFALGPHWYYALAAVLRLSGSAWSLLGFRWLLQAATVVGLAVLARSLAGPFAASVAVLLFVAHPVTADIFDWFTHPILALPLVVWTMLLAERWVARDDPRMGIVGLFVASLAFQLHVCSAATLLVLIASGVLLARPMAAGHALLAVGAFVLPFLPTRTWQTALHGDIPVGAVSVVPLACVALFALLWRGADRRRPVLAAAVAVLLLWALLAARSVQVPIRAVQFFNVVVTDRPWRSLAVGQIAWIDVATGSAHALAMTYMGPTEVDRFGLRVGIVSGILVLVGLAAVVRASRLGGRSTVVGRRAWLLLLWLALALPLALATNRQGVRARYFLALLPALAVAAGAGGGAVLERLPLRPDARARLGVLFAVALCLLPLRSFDRALVYVQEIPRSPSLHCRPDLLSTLRFAAALRTRARSAGVSQARVHGQLDRDGAMLDNRDSLLPLAWALDPEPARRTSDDDADRHVRIEPVPGDGASPWCPFRLVSLESALDLGHVRVLSGPAAGTTVSLPMRSAWTAAIGAVEPANPRERSVLADARDLELRRRPGAAWPPAVAIVANGQGERLDTRCAVEVEAGGASVERVPTHASTRTLLVVRGLSPADAALRIHLRGCAFHYLDAWDLAAGEAP